MRRMKTILGDIPETDLGITLVHEHICCYSEYVYTMCGSQYLDKDALVFAAVNHLKEMKKTYGLQTVIDCTPVNLGRDLELLKNIAEKSGVHIICATGFYHTEECLLRQATDDQIASYIISDAKTVNAGIIKCAVENPAIGAYDEKMLRASAKAQLALGIPIVLHTNANNQNGLAALEILFSEGVEPQAITVGHLSDTEDLEYVRKIAELGCYIGFDRLYDHESEAYINQKIHAIEVLCQEGYLEQILLSHDALFFNGFETECKIDPKPRFSYCFDHILPRLPKHTAETIMVNNPRRMFQWGGNNRKGEGI